MGATSCKGTVNGNRTITIAILGLDNAGKTTTTRALEKTSTNDVAPTMGFSSSEITQNNEKIKLIDLGGARSFRDAWRHYYADAHGFVYVLDSSEDIRLKENREVFSKLVTEEQVKGKPILILANKQDRPEALDKNAILEDLKIERLVNENKTLCRVELCTAKALSRKGKGSKVDEPIRKGFDWLLKVIVDDYDGLNGRVINDIKNREEAERQKKRERDERVRKTREEREKEKGDKDDEEDNEDTIKKGFVPIGQAIKNAEQNSWKTPSKSKSNQSDPSYKPTPAPRSFSNSRPAPVDEKNSDEDIRPRRHSSDKPVQRPSSPSQSESSRFDDREATNSNEDQTSIRSISGKKKKLTGPPRSRLNGPLPPLAPSSAASRRDDLTQSKGPPAGTPRPSGPVASWAVTCPTPIGNAEKLNTINSDNELDEDGATSKLDKRITSPHPTVTNRVRRDVKSPNRTNHRNEDDGDDLPKSRQGSGSNRRTPSNHRSPVRSHLRTEKNSDDDDER